MFGFGSLQRPDPLGPSSTPLGLFGQPTLIRCIGARAKGLSAFTNQRLFTGAEAITEALRWRWWWGSGGRHHFGLEVDIVVQRFRCELDLAVDWPVATAFLVDVGFRGSPEEVRISPVVKLASKLMMMSRMDEAWNMVLQLLDLGGEESSSSSSGIWRSPAL